MKIDSNTTWACDICDKQETTKEYYIPHSWMKMKVVWPNNDYFIECLTCRSCYPNKFNSKDAGNFLKRFVNSFNRKKSK